MPSCLDGGRERKAQGDGTVVEIEFHDFWDPVGQARIIIGFSYLPNGVS